MDIKIPVMDSYEATREIRKMNPGVKIIAQTAYALVGDMDKALQTGCIDFVSIPVSKDELLKKIRALT